MYDNKNIIQNAVNSKDHTTLVAAVKAGGLVGTLQGRGPLTAFAPTNAAFAALPAGTVDTLLKPENKGTLDKILTYHVVPGRLDSATLDQQIANGGGKAVLKTVQGTGKNLMITDEKGSTAHVTIADVYQSNGVIQVIDRVLLPNCGTEAGRTAIVAVPSGGWVRHPPKIWRGPASINSSPPNGKTP
jgi:uncharacterized surface protein with fasciclin (FAS1) repeats